MPKIKDDVPVIMLIRYGMSYYQSAKNSLNRECPMHWNYKGIVLGVSEAVDVLEGHDWPRHMACAAVYFPTMKDAHFWVEHSREIKQPDWLHGADIIAVPMTGKVAPPEQGKGCLQIMDMRFRDYEKFKRDYVSQAVPYLKAKGASPAMVSTKEYCKFRGLWDPQYIIVNKWSSLDDFRAAYESDEYQPMKQQRCETSSSDVILFNLECLETSRCHDH